MSNQQDQSTKSNGLGTDPMQRLASFKTPRDLTLGGIKPNKKVFIPNLNVSRNKNKSGPSANARDQRKDDNRNHRDKRNDRNKGPRNGPNVIKSSGVFSEGLGSVERHSSRSYSFRDSDPAPVMQKPTIRVKDVIKIDKELEDQKIRAVLGEEHGEVEAEDFKRTLKRDDPIRLPLDDGVPAVDIKPDVKDNVFENTDVLNLLKSDQPTLILLQLPDSLPGQGGSVDDDAPRRKNEPSTSTDETIEAKPKDSRCRLEDLEEGKIGKLRIHQSGRVTMALGDTLFEVCAGTKASFHQEVVSVACDNDSKSANIVSLGALHHKLNIVPDWEKLFKDIKM